MGVVIASRGKATATAALKELAGAGDATWQAVDVADGKSVARLIATAMGEHGRLDYAFNNGGSGYLTSVFLCMSAEIAAMKRSGTSVIVNNASVDGLRGYPFPGGAAYSAARHLSRMARHSAGCRLDETQQGGRAGQHQADAARNDRRAC